MRPRMRLALPPKYQTEPTIGCDFTWTYTCKAASHGATRLYLAEIFSGLPPALQMSNGAWHFDTLPQVAEEAANLLGREI